MPTEIRLATLRDANRLAILAAETFPLACPTGTTQQDIDSFIAANLSEARFEEYLSSPARMILLAVESAPTGYSMLNFGEPEDAVVRTAVRLRPTVELAKFFVAGSRHGTGTAQRLMAASLDLAVGQGSHSVWLGVGRRNARANRFYEKQGFAAVGTKTFRVGDQVFPNEIVRERHLSPSSRPDGIREAAPVDNLVPAWQYRAGDRGAVTRSDEHREGSRTTQLP